MKKILFLAFVPFLTFQSHAAEDLEDALSNLSDSDRKVVIDIKQEVATWSQKLRDEVKAYQDSIITLRAEANEKYEALSVDAKSALKKEEQLTSKLSADAIKQLETVAKADMPAKKSQ